MNIDFVKAIIDEMGSCRSVGIRAKYRSRDSDDVLWR